MFRVIPAENIEGFLADMTAEDSDDDMAITCVDQDLIREVGCRHVLHWNYRNYTALPAELLGRMCLCGVKCHI